METVERVCGIGLLVFSFLILFWAIFHRDITAFFVRHSMKETDEEIVDSCIEVLNKKRHNDEE